MTPQSGRHIWACELAAANTKDHSLPGSAKRTTLMNDQQFSKMLHMILMKQSNYSLPFPPVSLNEQALYMEFAGRYLCPAYQMEGAGKAWYDSPEIMDLCARFPSEWRGLHLPRKYNFMQLLKLVGKVPGDTAECGVFKGASSWLIMRHAGENPVGGVRQHHIFDSFEGISEPGNDDGDYWTKGDLSCSQKKVAANLREFDDRCHYHKGWIPERFDDVAQKKFAFVHIDVDLSQPTRDSIEFFYPRLNDGAVLVCDDYGSAFCPGATKVMDEFLADKPEKMVGLSTTGGFFIKSLAM